MAKYHVNSTTGEAGACKAVKGNCPFGGEAEHYTSAGAARDAYEASMKVAGMTPTKKVKVADREYSGPSVKALRDREVTTIFMERVSSPTSKAQLKKVLELMDQAYANSNTSQRDNFAVARNMDQEFRALATAQTDITPAKVQDYGYAVAHSAFAYVSPYVTRASNSFENELNDMNWHTRTTGEPFEFEEIYARAAKRAHGTPKELAKAFEAEAKAIGWQLEDGFEEDLLKASEASLKIVKKDSDAYSRELRTIS